MTQAARDIVVGMGFVTDHRRVWFAAQSLTVLRYENGRIQLTILNERGRIRLVNLTTPMNSFVEFWQRWMHPHPPPELATAFITPFIGGN